MREAKNTGRTGRLEAALTAVVGALLGVLAVAGSLRADGMVVPPMKYRGVPYEGSIEERSQEAILIFHASKEPGGAREDLILKISVEGEVDNFAWVVPLPDEPEVAKEDPKLFDELYAYVEARLAYDRTPPSGKSSGAEGEAEPAVDEPPPVEVLSREIVGSFDVAVVREHERGALNDWLEREGYQRIENADDVLDFYHRKKYVFACIKVDQARLDQQKPVDLHPLRFSFSPGGRDGMYFPMKMTGLQTKPFDVNLYVFYGKWVNDQLSKFGYQFRGFRRKYRDWDTRQCEPNAGKKYSAPELDRFLTGHAHRLPTVKALMQKLHPGEQYYLTNIQARRLKPDDVRKWADDLWLFPYYTDRGFVPYDARPGGPASAAWPESVSEKTPPSTPTCAMATSIGGLSVWALISICGGAGLLAGVLGTTVVIGLAARRRKSPEE